MLTINTRTTEIPVNLVRRATRLDLDSKLMPNTNKKMMGEVFLRY